MIAGARDERPDLGEDRLGFVQTTHVEQRDGQPEPGVDDEPGHEPASGLVPDQPEPLLRQLEVGTRLRRQGPRARSRRRWATSSCAVTASSSSVSAAGTRSSRWMKASQRTRNASSVARQASGARPAGRRLGRSALGPPRRSLRDDLALRQAVLEPDQHQRVDRVEGHITGGSLRRLRGRPRRARSSRGPPRRAQARTRPWPLRAPPWPGSAAPCCGRRRRASARGRRHDR